MNYEELGLKCGLEIHQQLDTRKLFCKCKSIVHDENPDIFFTRKLRPVAGETGEIDQAAAHEMEKGKIMKYEACSTSSCLVEMDEEPPGQINEEAVEISLQIAKMLHMRIVDEIQVMRKTVIDGSNVGGFQRTALIAMDGFLETSKGKVAVPTLCLEEEAAKKIKEDEKAITYRLDRLGVPLVEIATDASMNDPEHAKETASLIGMILRSTKRVKRGIGTIRQDVNVSIKGSARVEIKGFQDLRNMPLVIDTEIRRLQKLEKHEPEVRKVNPDNTTSFLRPMPGAARMYPETDVLPFKVNLEKITVPKLLTEQVKELEKKWKINDDAAKELLDLDLVDQAESFIAKNKNLEPKYIVEVMLALPKEIKKRYKLDAEKLTEKEFSEVLLLINKEEVVREAAIELLASFLQGKSISEEAKKYAPINDKILLEEIKKIVQKNPGKPIGALMGIAMKELRGKVDGKKVNEFLNKLI
ncbi:Glu-tRNA(Gln) amidotransferase subunit GatE [Candidatus Woesearchaeota archaeon]|nr:MAG: glutamyl-tRNA(Gln) amidotransferase subunit E [archaeon GW2011_AR4]MBS3129282.1 Glu-tRNA(Gln) amidotransferase subunit GatE [Candidatus Woesearchaeota archaeon]HIH38585.1 Glu-tRNA(Gln) amidotransferase subunit GatE [Candidatus Woesearchaeota archaeon]HIH48542.1 Glu-tRNA(Gln) amidotransferase subunit GatE [Candidatus Woesearchaeota archaeon]HIJ02789.1 Glu-tRNA(Gln) amidotransferase subunit GatE [Candidatus Woesearchaeota archaeon]